MARLTGGEAIVQSLLAHGTDTVFCLPGVQTYFLFNALYDATDKIRVIHTRHEQGAGYMALGYALASDRIGVYNVVPGPGVLNTTAALSTAYARNAQVLCLAGQLPYAYIGQNIGLLHEIPDQTGIIRSLTKWIDRINNPNEATAIMAEAFRQLRAGRPRPVAVECPMDVLAMENEVGPVTVEAVVHPPVDSDAINEAAKLLGNAQRPMIFVGSGASHAQDEIRQIAEALQAPVIAGQSGRGILDSRHYLSHTHPAGHRFWDTADVVLAIGSRIATPLTYWGYDEHLKIIRIDLDPAEHHRIIRTDVSIIADALDALTELIPAVEKHNSVRETREHEMLSLKEDLRVSWSTLEPQISYLKVIREELPEDGIFVDEATQIGYVSWFAMPAYHPKTLISPGYQGTLGWGFPTALGCKVAQPHKRVISVNGDGGFMFNIQELATAVQHNIGVVALVFNDGGYGNVRTMQADYFDGRTIGCDLQNPDFTKLAETFGAQGLKANTPEELRSAIRLGFEHSGPTVIEIPVGEMPGPWRHIRMPQIRGYPRPAPDGLPPPKVR